MGFSVIGFCICMAIMIPNLLYVFFKPQNIPSGLSDAGLLVTMIERIGQAGCFIVLILSKDNFQNVRVNIIFAMMATCIVVYVLLWMRYVMNGRDFALLFKPIRLISIPIPMAVFPVLAFGFAAIWGESILLGVFVLILSIGHFINSWHTYRCIKTREES